MYSLEDKERALRVLEECDGNLSMAARMCGGPSRGAITNWKNLRDRGLPLTTKKRGIACHAEKVSALRALDEGQDPAMVADRLGVHRSTLMHWRRTAAERGMIALMTDKDRRSVFREPDVPKDREELERRCEELELRNAILEETIKILKKDPGAETSALTNREKATMATALRGRFPLKTLLGELGLARSTYYYERAAASAPDKYARLRVRIARAFEWSRASFGSERIWATLRCLT